MGSAPSPPDPYATAAAQAKANKESAVASQELSMVNQNTPWGSLDYKQTGTSAAGTPTYTATTTLSPDQQTLLDQQTGIAKKVNTIAGAQTDRIGSLLSTPLNIDNEATEARLMELGRKRLDPAWADRERALSTDLANKGIAIGTPAYDKAMASFNQGRNDSYNQLALTGRQQAVAEALAERNQPINEITALLSGGQVTQPNFVSTPQASVAAPDIQGLVTNAYNQQVAQHNSKMGGLFSLGGSLLGGGMRLLSGGFK